jgi:hypothetical protein
MQPYKGYFIDGTARIIHPFSPLWKSGRLGSVIEVIRFDLRSFTVSMKELAEWFGFEFSKLVVDEFLNPR